MTLKSTRAHAPGVSIAVHLVLIVATLFLATSHYVTSADVARDGKLWWLTGSPQIRFSGSELHIQLIEPKRLLHLVFSSDLTQAPQALGNTPRTYDVQWLPSNARLVSIQATELTGDADTNSSESIQSLSTIHLAFAAPLRSHAAMPYALNSVTADAESMKPAEFMERFIDEDRSNLWVYYPFAIKNLSPELAQRLGPALLWALLLVLTLMLLVQMFSFGLAVVWRVGTEFFAGQWKTSTGVVWIDQITDAAAIPLGLFGTVVGIWVALEGSGTSFASFFDALTVLQTAVLTTVLGMSAKTALMLRYLLRPEEVRSDE